MPRYEITNNHIELYFEEIPDPIMRESLKICGWRWYSPKQCWSNFLNEENIQWAKNLCMDQKTEEDSLSELDTHAFSVENLILRSNSFYCNLHHIIEDVAGEIDICDRKGNIRTYLVPLAYCASCDRYYILEGTYKALKTKGIILCQIMTVKEYAERGPYYDNSKMWRDKSLLRIWGYSVSEEEGLTEDQRHCILESILDAGIMKKDRMLSYIDFFKQFHSHLFNANRKWQADRDYISQYKIGSVKRIKIGGVFKL